MNPRDEAFEAWAMDTSRATASEMLVAQNCWDAAWYARDHEIAALQATVARLREALAKQHDPTSSWHDTNRCFVCIALDATAADTEAWLAQQKREWLRGFARWYLARHEREGVTFEGTVVSTSVAEYLAALESQQVDTEQERRIIKALFDGHHDGLTGEQLREHVEEGCEHCRATLESQQ